MRLVSGLADLLVLLPASLAFIGLLLRLGAAGEAAAYAKALLFCLIATFLMKFSLAVCEAGGHPFGVESPSGHVAFSATFYGCVALTLSARRSSAVQGAVAVGVVAFIVLVAISRVVLRAHTRAETIVGATVGLLAIAIFLFNRPKHAPTDAPLSARSTLVPLVAVFLLLGLPIANHWTAEPWIDAMAAEFGALTHLCE